MSSATTITNNSDVGVLLKVFYALYKDDGSKILAMKKDFSSFNINNTFISADKNVEQACAGDYYYNAVLEANTSVNLINTITPAIDSSLLGQTLRLKIQAEVVNYIGGPYYTWRDLPWTDYPPAWFVNQSYITKAEGSLVTPHIPGTFADFSKIEMTVKTSVNSLNMLFGIRPAYYADGIWIGINRVGEIVGSKPLASTTSGMFVNFRSSLTSDQLANGNWNTLIVEWDEVTWTDYRDDQYITLTWGDGWDSEKSYKQIKFYDTNGKLVYDLRPDDRTGKNTGKFYNFIDGTVLDMYSGASSATVTNSAYATSDNLVMIDNFEKKSIGSNAANSGYFTVAVEENGNKYARSVQGTNAGTLYFGGISIKKGEIYNISFRYKTNAKREEFYSKDARGYWSEILSVNHMKNYRANYSFSEDWGMVSFCSEATDTATFLMFYFTIPQSIKNGDNGIFIGVDDIVIRKLP